MALRSYLVTEVTEDFADGLLTRREALRRLVLLGLSVNAAAAVLAACGDGGEGAEGPTATNPMTPAKTSPSSPGATRAPATSE
jgi:carboxymethylenebutenolidase